LNSEITPEYKMEFDKKVRNFRSQYTMCVYDADLEISIDRKNLFYDAYENIMNENSRYLKKRLNIKYKKEEGIDIGGLLR